MGIKSIQDSAMTRDQIGEILNAVMSLYQRENQVTYLTYDR